MSFRQLAAARLLLFEEAIGTNIRAEVAREEAEAKNAAALLRKQETV